MTTKRIYDEMITQRSQCASVSARGRCNVRGSNHCTTTTTSTAAALADRDAMKGLDSILQFSVPAVYCSSLDSTRIQQQQHWWDGITLQRKTPVEGALLGEPARAASTQAGGHIEVKVNYTVQCCLGTARYDQVDDGAAGHTVEPSGAWLEGAELGLMWHGSQVLPPLLNCSP